MQLDHDPARARGTTSGSGERAVESGEAFGQDFGECVAHAPLFGWGLPGLRELLDGRALSEPARD
jgi:hypothetical protein